MPVSTTAGLINVGRGTPINAFPTSPETNKVMLHAAGMRTPKEVVAEFFGLRQAKEYDDQGNIIDIIDETKDVEALIRVGAHYNKRFEELGLTREMFDAIIPPRLLTIAENANKPLASNQ